MKLSDFSSGERVIYVPGHAHNDLTHPDCEHGVVSSVGVQYVFVKFNPRALNGVACDPADLVKAM